MITAPVPAPAHRRACETRVREALDRIDELLDPADGERGLGAVLATVTPHTQGLARQARLALAARCVAHRIRQEATEALVAAASALPGRQSPADLAALDRRLRRKGRELRLSIELRLPGRLARADEALQALAASGSLSDTLRGFVLTTACRYRVLDAAWIDRLEALAPLLQSPRSPLATLTARFAQLGLQCRALSGLREPGPMQRLAVELFHVSARAAEVLAATRARLARSPTAQDGRTLAALDSDRGLEDLACLAIGSTPLGPGGRHAPLCSLLVAALASESRTLVDQALQARAAACPQAVNAIDKVLQGWTCVSGAADRARTARAAAAPVQLPPRLQQAVEAFLDADWAA